MAASNLKPLTPHSFNSSKSAVLDFNSILSDLDLPTRIIEVFSDYLQNVFQLIFDCGVQIILFLAGLQSIPASFYEVSKIEGATKWEEFWFITIPMLRNIILLVIIYTMISLFTAADNSIMSAAMRLMSAMDYGVASAMLWFYFVIALSFIGIALVLYNKLCVKKWE